MSVFLLSGLKVLKGGSDLMVHTEVWDTIVHWVLLSLLLVEEWGPFSVFGLHVLGVFEGGENISINSVIWDTIVSWPFIIWTWFVWGGGLGVASEGSALWGRCLVDFIFNLKV